MINSMLLFVISGFRRESVLFWKITQRKKKYFLTNVSGQRIGLILKGQEPKKKAGKTNHPTK